LNFLSYSRVYKTVPKALLSKGNNHFQEFVKEKLGKHEYPRKVEFVISFPETVDGKIRQVELRERERMIKQ